jgi:hypothetical protein
MIRSPTSRSRSCSIQKLQSTWFTARTTPRSGPDRAPCTILSVDITPSATPHHAAGPHDRDPTLPYKNLLGLPLLERPVFTAQHILDLGVSQDQLGVHQLELRVIRLQIHQRFTRSGANTSKRSLLQCDLESRRLSSPHRRCLHRPIFTFELNQ